MIPQIPIPRWLKRRRLKQRLNSGCLNIVLGSGKTEVRDWIGTDIDTLNITQRCDWLNYFEPGSVHALLAEHVWEHLSAEDASAGALNCFEFLRPGGHLRIGVPDGYNPNPHYIEHVRPGGSGEGADDHKSLYTHETLSALFSRVGFQIRLLEYWDSRGDFHFQEWETSDGMIRRSKRFDPRNAAGKLEYTSLILDAIKS